MSEETSVNKVCSFYVSDLHLVTMLLPYLDKKIKNGEKTITIFEENLETNVKLVLSRLLLGESDKAKLLELDWKKSSNIFSKIEDNKNEDTLNIIVNGSKDFIDKVNENLDNYLKIVNFGKTTIVNCYDIKDLDEDMKEILSTHDKILNTVGENNVGDVFTGYEKRKLA